METLIFFPLIIFLEYNTYSENILRQFQYLSQPNFLITSAKIFKHFFACRIANHQYPGNIHRLSRQQAVSQQQQSFNKQYHSRNQQSTRNQQQLPQAAINQEPAVATSSSNQQQQSVAATGTSNQHSSINQHSSYQQHLLD